MDIPATFENAFKGIRAHLVAKILTSPRFWNLMLDKEVLTIYHVEEIKVPVFAYFIYI